MSTQPNERHQPGSANLKPGTAASPGSSVNQIVAMLKKHNQADQHEAATNEVRLNSTAVLPVRRSWLQVAYACSLGFKLACQQHRSACTAA